MADEEVPKAAIVAVGASVIGKFSMNATVRTRTNLAMPHLMGALRFSRRVAEIEAENAGKSFGNFYDEARAFSSACVLSAVAGLEAYANEIYADGDQNFPGADPTLIERCWELLERVPILDKFNFALVLLKVDEFNKGTEPYQDADALIQLRNALVHFKPEWSDENANHVKLSGRLKGKFATNPAFETEPVFPRAWVSHGCTKWAVEATVNFIREFEKYAGLKSKLATFKGVV